MTPGLGVNELAIPLAYYM